MERFLSVLEENAHASLEELAAILDITPEQAAVKIDEYTDNGRINGSRALINRELASVTRVQAITELKVTPRRDRSFEEIAQAVAAFDEVDSVSLMSGGYDLALIVTGRSFQDIALFVAKNLSPLDGVLSTATHFVLRTYKKDGVFLEFDNSGEQEL